MSGTLRSVIAPALATAGPSLRFSRGKTVAMYGGFISKARLPTDSTGTATLRISGLPAGCDIVVLEAGTTTVKHQVDAHPGTYYDYLYEFFVIDTTVDIGLIKPGYEIFYIRNLALPRANSVLPVALRIDRNFS